MRRNVASGRAKVQLDNSSHSGHDPHLNCLAPPLVLSCRNNRLAGGNEAAEIKCHTPNKLGTVWVEARLVQSGGETVIHVFPSSIPESKHWAVLCLPIKTVGTCRKSESFRSDIGCKLWRFGDELQHSLYVVNVSICLLLSQSGTHQVLSIISQYGRNIYSVWLCDKTWSMKTLL